MAIRRTQTMAAAKGPRPRAPDQGSAATAAAASGLDEDAFSTLKLRSACFGLDAHPSKHLLAAGLISGQVKLFSYDTPSEDPEGGSARQLWSARPHEGACRATVFAADGASLYSTGGDGTLQQRDIEANKPLWRRRRAHKSAVNALTRMGDSGGVATGDDDGVVRCWDMRQRSVALEFCEQSDYVSDILYTDQKNKHTLVVSGGDGYLAVFDLRAGRLWARSDQQEDELLCLCLLKRGKKLLTGTEGGPVGIFSWGDWGDISDRMLGHPSSVDAMVAHSEDHVITGAADGLLRLVSVHPNKVLGVLGEHGEAGVEALTLDHDHQVLASAAHDNTIRLWDIKYLEDDGEEGEEDPDDGEGDADDDDDDSDDDDSDDDGAASSVPKLAKTSKGRAASSRASSVGDYTDGASTLGGRKRKQVADIPRPGAAISLSQGFFRDM